MLVVTLRATIALTGQSMIKALPFRQTLSFDGRKALCNFESIAPLPLERGVSGEAVITVIWDQGQRPVLRVGAPFIVGPDLGELARAKIIAIEAVEER
jgi:hypothetical protein